MRIMRFAGFLTLILCFNATILAQRPTGHFDEWGGVTADELKMTACSFEKDAEAMLLLDLGQIYYSRSDDTYLTSGKFRITSAYYKRIKIFNEKGIRRADIQLDVYTGAKQEIKNINAYSYNLVGNEIQKKGIDTLKIRTVKLNKILSRISFTVPDVKAGSVMEVGYDLEQDVSYTLPSWYFTRDVPCARSSLTVGFLDCIVYYVDKHMVTGDLDEKSEVFNSDISVNTQYAFGAWNHSLQGKVVTYTTHNQKAFHPEPFTNSNRNYMNWVGFQLRGVVYPINFGTKTFINSFNKFAAVLYNDIRFEVSLNNPMPKKIWSQLITDSMDAEAKSLAIYEYIRSNMHWNGLSSWRPSESNDKSWKDKRGSRADINLLLISTLRAAGITAYPMLTGSRDKGDMNVSYPILDEYTGVDALVILDSGRKLLLDATNKYLPAGEPASDQLNTMGLVIEDRNRTSWYQIRNGRPSAMDIIVTAALADDGSIDGTLEAVYTNHAANTLILAKNQNDQSEINNLLKAQMPNATLGPITDTIDASACRFTQKVNFTIQPPMDNEGNIFLSVLAFYGTTSSSFASKERIPDVDFGYSVRSTISVQLSLPASYAPDSMYQPVMLRMSDSSALFMSGVELDDGYLHWQQRKEFKRSYYKVDEYPALFDFDKQYTDLKQRPIVLHKKL